MPGLAALNKGDAEVDSVSCGSAGNCAAGGSYMNGRGNGQGFVAVERGGVWGNAIEVPGLAALDKGQYGAVTSVSCPPAGTCAAGGTYTRLSHFQGFVTVSTQDVLNRFVAALGGTLKLIADFGDEQLKIA